MIFYFNIEKNEKKGARRHGTAQPAPARPTASRAMPGHFSSGPGRPWHGRTSIGASRARRLTCLMRAVRLVCPNPFKKANGNLLLDFPFPTQKKGIFTVQLVLHMTFPHNSQILNIFRRTVRTIMCDIARPWDIAQGNIYDIARP